MLNESAQTLANAHRIGTSDHPGRGDTLGDTQSVRQADFKDILSRHSQPGLSLKKVRTSSNTLRISENPAKFGPDSPTPRAAVTAARGSGWAKRPESTSIRKADPKSQQPMVFFTKKDDRVSHTQFLQ